MATSPRRTSSLSYLVAFPMLLVPFALYNMIAFLLDLNFSEQVFRIPRLSAEPMPVSTGDTLVLLSILLLYIEILKATRMSIREIMDHVLSLVLFFAMLSEFIVVERAGTSTFLILLALSFVDVIGGFTVTVRAARRDVTLDTHTTV